MATKPDFLKIFQKIGLQFKKNALYLTLENLIFLIATLIAHATQWHFGRYGN